jgi:hypothetical protein
MNIHTWIVRYGSIFTQKLICKPKLRTDVYNRRNLKSERCQNRYIIVVVSGIYLNDE